MPGSGFVFFSYSLVVKKNLLFELIEYIWKEGRTTSMYVESKIRFPKQHTIINPLKIPDNKNENERMGGHHHSQVKESLVSGVSMK